MISYDRSRASCPCTLLITISSSTSVRATSSRSPRRTAAASPITCCRWYASAKSRSEGVHGYASASSGLGISPGRPCRRRSMPSACARPSRAASSAVSAAITPAAIIAYGFSRSSDGWKCSRYSASAGSVCSPLKWCANANGSPRIPASCAL